MFCGWHDRMLLWCYKIMPLVYDDSLSYYEVLCKLTKYVNQIIDDEKKIAEQLDATVADVKELQDALKNGNFEKIFNEYMRQSMKLVWFGLNDNGRFVAYIPDSWKEIMFSTILDYNNPYYGHLVLGYDDTTFTRATTYQDAWRNGI